MKYRIVTTDPREGYRPFAAEYQDGDKWLVLGFGGTVEECEKLIDIHQNPFVPEVVKEFEAPNQGTKV